MKQNTECYYFEELIFDKGLFHKTIDATYILYLEGSDRINSINKQIYEIIPTKKNIYCS
jgi:hypothetical protein